jgi:hypothetical protein
MPDEITAAVRGWLESVVIGLNLCPFARRELIHDRVRFSVSDAASEVQLLQALEAELEHLANDAATETSLLIHPNILQDFADYNQFLELADGLLVQMQLDGVFQIASFHPDYQFADTDPDAAENYTNRSPYPMLHLLREDSLSRVIESTADIDQIPLRNIRKMNQLGTEKLKILFGR